MAAVDEEAKRITELVEKTLKALYGFMSVWNVSVDEISKTNNRIHIKGVYSPEIKPEHWFSFEIELNSEYHLLRFKRELLPPEEA